MMISLHNSSKYYWKNGEFLPLDTTFDLYKSESPVYEVVRYNGELFFFDDHISRLKISLAGLGAKPKTIHLPSTDEMRELFVKNNFPEGNVRIDVFPKAGTTVAYLTTFFYPPEELYRDGVKVIFQYDERKNQQIKQFQEEIKIKTAELLIKTGAFETLLVNKHGQITEGSKSNVFFIKEGKIYTAPDLMILAGVTRKKVIRIIENMGLTIIYQAIVHHEITDYEAVFLTGTSIGVLPVKAIENNNYDPKNRVVREIMKYFNQKMIQERFI